MAVNFNLSPDVQRLIAQYQANQAQGAAGAGQSAPTAPVVPLNFPAYQAPVDTFTASDATRLSGLRSGTDNLRLFGGDRKTAVETLIASGAKAENPKVGFVKNIFRKVFGGTTNTTKDISAKQKIETNVKNKNFHVEDLRLSTVGQQDYNSKTVRHIDFKPVTPEGRAAEVKDIGTVIAKGTPIREFEQNIEFPGAGQNGNVTSGYFDPKTGKKFLQTSETGPQINQDKLGAYHAADSKQTSRQIDLLNGDGQATQRYVFGNTGNRLENLSADGSVSSSSPLGRGVNYSSLVDSLSKTPPSVQAEQQAALESIRNNAANFNFSGLNLRGLNLQIP
jgi:hypothetical protein